MNSPSSPLSRRHLLQAVGVTSSVAIAGCLTKTFQGASCKNQVRLSLTKVTDAHISNEFSTPVDGLPYGSKAVVNNAIETGEATSRGYYSPQPHDEYVVTSPNPRFYRTALPHTTAQKQGATNTPSTSTSTSPPSRTKIESTLSPNYPRTTATLFTVRLGTLISSMLRITPRSGSFSRTSVLRYESNRCSFPKPQSRTFGGMASCCG